MANTLNDKKLPTAIALVAKLYNLDAKKLEHADPQTVIRALTRYGWRWNGAAWHLPERAWMDACRKDAPTPKTAVKTAEK